MNSCKCSTWKDENNRVFYPDFEKNQLINWTYKALVSCLIYDRAYPNGYFERFGVTIFQGHVVSDLDRSTYIIAANAFALALIYPFGYTFCANFISAVILNLSNQGKMSKL